MKFSTTHQRAITGNDIVVGIEGERSELISRVTTSLDGFELGTDDLDPPSTSYEREFPRAGDAGPNMEHKLTITVTDPDGKTKAGFREWLDPV
jgi:hypothetical protein